MDHQPLYKEDYNDEDEIKEDTRLMDDTPNMVPLENQMQLDSYIDYVLSVLRPWIFLS